MEAGWDVNSKERYGWYCTPLTCALEPGSFDPEIVEYLIAHGADLHVHGKNGDSLLHMTCYPMGCYGPDPDRLICAPGAFELLLKHKLDPNERNQNGETPLYIACSNWQNTPEKMNLLLKYGADPNIAANDGKVPLQFTAG